MRMHYTFLPGWPEPTLEDWLPNFMYVNLKNLNNISVVLQHYLLKVLIHMSWLSLRVIRQFRWT